jgi:hypothetical protein
LHIRDKLEESHKKIKEHLGEDDLVDYILVFVLTLIALGGFMLWRNVKEQEK